MGALGAWGAVVWFVCCVSILYALLCLFLAFFHWSRGRGEAAVADEGCEGTAEWAVGVGARLLAPARVRRESRSILVSHKAGLFVPAARCR